MSQSVLLTQEEINKLLDSTKDYAKELCEKIYNKTAKEIGGNEYFKKILNETFSDVADIEIKTIREDFDIHFETLKTDVMDTKTIAEILFTRKAIQELIHSRRCCKTLNIAVISCINQSVMQAFTEKLAEYIGIDISEIINKEN